MSESGQSINKGDVSSLFMDSLSKGVDSLDQHRYKDGEETKKVLGFEMDSAFANIIEVMYSSFIGGATRQLTPKVADTVHHLGKGRLETTALNRTAAGAAFAVNTGIYALPSITTAYGLWAKQADAKREVIRQLSPVLDELKGKHGIAAYNSVRVEDNEMIAQHRWRMAKLDHAKLTHMILPAIAKVAPNIYIHEGASIEAMRRGESIKKVELEHFHRQVAADHGDAIAEGINSKEGLHLDGEDVNHETVAKYKKEEFVKNAIRRTEKKAAETKNANGGFNLNGLGGSLASNATLTTIANKIVESSSRRLKHSFPSDYDATDMVLNLQQQLGGEPTPRTFQLPNKGRSLPLEGYIAEIMMQHQRDMANMDPNYAVIRDALRENVVAAAKPLAEAVSKGDISALTLISYIGGGKIIRNKGRTIASADEVSAMIEHDAGKHVQSISVNAKDFWSDEPYNEKEAKAALAVLEGEERQIAIAMIPHSVRKDFGISDKESKEVDGIAAKQMERHFAEALLGAEALETDETLTQKRLAKTEIARLHESSGKVAKKGEEAMHELKSTAMHPNGIDRVLLSVIIDSAHNGERHYLGKLMEKGREQLADKGSKGEHGAKHTKRVEDRRASQQGAEMDID